MPYLFFAKVGGTSKPAVLKTALAAEICFDPEIHL
jgi:hypothetical protein